jgi:hypothetical protein
MRYAHLSAFATVLLTPVPAFVACNSPRIAQKAGDLSTRQIPLDVYVH